MLTDSVWRPGFHRSCSLVSSPVAVRTTVVRILRVLTRLNLGGPARQVLASDPLLVERGHVLRVLVGHPEPGEGDLFGELQARGIEVRRVHGLKRGISPLRDFFVRGRLRREIEEFEPDLMHTHASKAGALGRRALEKARGGEEVARVHTFHGHVLEGYFPDPISRRLQQLERRLARVTDRIVAVSHSTSEDLLRLEIVRENQLVVVPPGIELRPLLGIDRRGGTAAKGGPLRELIGASESDVLIGVIGRLAEVKRPTLAVDVFAKLTDRFPSAHLVFIGDGAERGALERHIGGASANVRARCHMIGSQPDPAAFLTELDIVLATSRSEGMPVALIEAAAAGLPVVATAVGGVPELVAHERTGFAASDETELIYGLGQLLERPEERLAMGQRARLRVSHRHSAKALTDRLEAVYGVALDLRRGQVQGNSNSGAPRQLLP
ncbi:MAG: glycosyltransferase involved in cell wall biosynthesis [Planctomycetota bacterium]|jgi:glycosyltransferase involved in cell wall biosynthesis